MDQATTQRTKTPRGPTATDDVWRRDEIESPCVKLCSIHPAAGICVGCLRTGAEIGGWSAMTRDERRAIMAELPGRKALLRRRRGGHAARTADQVD